MKKLYLIMAILLSVIFLFGCREDAGYRKITPQRAKEIMDTLQDDDVVILDVRTEAEFRQGHIEGALLIPDYDILSQAEQKLPDKNKTILVYCRTGNRSRRAAKDLISLGYKDVYDFGGIVDWDYGLV